MPVNSRTAFRVLFPEILIVEMAQLFVLVAANIVEALALMFIMVRVGDLWGSGGPVSNLLNWCIDAWITS
ncbi:MAG: hypothetical protein ACKESB_00315 [Candidatus Hodgkinia cicadicola]